LRARLEPKEIRAILSFAGLLLVVYEMVKQAVVRDVRGFYLTGFDETGMFYDEDGYSREVRSLDKSPFRASAKWLVKRGAITDEQVDVLERLYVHRKDIAHELPKYLVDPEFFPDIHLFIEAAHVLIEIRKFWTQVEIDIGTFEAHGDVAVDDVQPLSIELLKMFIGAFADGLTGEPVPEDGEPSEASAREATGAGG
jgi:hypothetical protein